MNKLKKSLATLVAVASLVNPLSAADTWSATKGKKVGFHDIQSLVDDTISQEKKSSYPTQIAEELKSRLESLPNNEYVLKSEEDDERFAVSVELYPDHLLTNLLVEDGRVQVKDYLNSGRLGFVDKSDCVIIRMNEKENKKEMLFDSCKGGKQEVSLPAIERKSLSNLLGEMYFLMNFQLKSEERSAKLRENYSEEESKQHKQDVQKFMDAISNTSSPVDSEKLYRKFIKKLP